MPEGRPQVVRYGIGKRFQLLVTGLERCRSLCEFPIERLNLLLPALSPGNVVAGFENCDGAILLITAQRPSARYDHLRAVGPSALQFAFPAVRLLEFRLNLINRFREDRAQQFHRRFPERLGLFPAIEFLSASIPISNDGIHTAYKY